MIPRKGTETPCIPEGSSIHCRNFLNDSPKGDGNFGKMQILIACFSFQYFLNDSPKGDGNPNLIRLNTIQFCDFLNDSPKGDGNSVGTRPLIAK